MEKTAAQKMQVKPGMKLAAFGAPDDYEDLLGGLPDNASLVADAAAADAVHVFLEDLDGLDARLAPLLAAREGALLWASYPKGLPKEVVNRDSLWLAAREYGLEAVSQVSLDERWSAMRFKRV